MLCQRLAVSDWSEFHVVCEGGKGRARKRCLKHGLLERKGQSRGVILLLKLNVDDHT